MSFRKPYTIYRKPGEYANGNWQEGQETTITIMASVQPLKPSELQALPEGRRERAAVKIYTDTQLYSAKEETENTPGRNSDILDFMGGRYEVVGVAPYQSGIIPHFKAIAVEV